MTTTPTPDPTPLFKACIDMIPRTGARALEFRYSEPEHEGSPVVWIAIAEYQRQGRPVHETGAALAPDVAAFRLLEQLLDGGRCVHCTRPTGITLNHGWVPMSSAFCWFQLDPELSVFRRGCA